VFKERKNGLSWDKKYLKQPVSYRYFHFFVAYVKTIYHDQKLSFLFLFIVVKGLMF